MSSISTPMVTLFPPLCITSSDTCHWIWAHSDNQDELFTFLDGYSCLYLRSSGLPTAEFWRFGHILSLGFVPSSQGKPEALLPMHPQASWAPAHVGGLWSAGQERPCHGVQSAGQERPCCGVWSLGQERPCRGVRSTGWERPCHGVQSAGQERPCRGVWSAGRERPLQIFPELSHLCPPGCPLGYPVHIPGSRWDA